MLELDIGGWLLGPEFLGSLAAFISSILSSIAAVIIGRAFGTTP